MVVLPNRLREDRMWSPDWRRPMQVARIADMPEAVPTQAAPPSSAARRVSKARTVGFVKRE
jgi:hypothetical protein